MTNTNALQFLQHKLLRSVSVSFPCKIVNRVSFRLNFTTRHCVRYKLMNNASLHSRRATCANLCEEATKCVSFHSRSFVRTRMTLASVNIPWKNALYLIAHHYQRSLIIQLRWNQSISTRQSSDNSFISDSTGIHTRDLDYTCVPNWRGYGVLVCKMRCWYRAGKIFIYHLITYNSK